MGNIAPPIPMQVPCHPTLLISIFFYTVEFVQVSFTKGGVKVPYDKVRGSVYPSDWIPISRNWELISPKLGNVGVPLTMMYVPAHMRAYVYVHPVGQPLPLHPGPLRGVGRGKFLARCLV